MQGAFRFDCANGLIRQTALCDAIPQQQSTRADYVGAALFAADQVILANAASVPGVDLMLITDRGQINRARDLIIAANSAQMADPAFEPALQHWLRFNPRRAIAAGDVLFSATSGKPVLPGRVVQAGRASQCFGRGPRCPFRRAGQLTT